MNLPVVLLVLSCLMLGGCGSNPASELEVVGASMKSEPNISTAAPLEMGMSIPANGELYWIEGMLKNHGANAVTRVSIIFRCTDGNTRRLFLAEVAAIPAGKAAEFRTDKVPSHLPIRILEEEPEIQVGR